MQYLCVHQERIVYGACSEKPFLNVLLLVQSIKMIAITKLFPNLLAENLQYFYALSVFPAHFHSKVLQLEICSSAPRVPTHQYLQDQDKDGSNTYQKSKQLPSAG